MVRSMNMLAHAELRPFRLRIEDYELLDRAGVFNGHRVELIGGLVIEMSPQQRPHSYTKNELAYRLRRALEKLESTLIPQVEVTTTVPPQSAPEPDIVLTDAPMGEGYVPVSSVALAVEVADTTLRHDLGTKEPLYASAAIPEYWVVDVNARRVHQFWEPTDSRYAQTRIVPLAGPLASATIPDLLIDGTGIL